MKDWDKQMAEIDKAMSKLPQEPPRTEPPQRRATGADVPQAAPGGKGASVAAVPRRGGMFWVWTRLILVSLLAGGLAFWPYQRECGLGLAGYMLTLMLVCSVGVWTAVDTWRMKRGLPHVLALVVALSGLLLLAHEFALRTGYASIQYGWLCGG